jgi:hypothetical protein
VILILQHLMHYKDLASIITQLSNDASAAARTAPTSTNPFNQDVYSVGAEVDILGDPDDADYEFEGPLLPLVVIARGRVKGLFSDVAAGTKVYEVRGLHWFARKHSCPAMP